MSAAAAAGGFKVASAFMKHEARKRKNAEYNAWKYKKDLATKKRLRIQEVKSIRVLPLKIVIL